MHKNHQVFSQVAWWGELVPLGYFIDFKSFDVDFWAKNKPSPKYGVETLKSYKT
jgi:hypothetical protein